MERRFRRSRMIASSLRLIPHLAFLFFSKKRAVMKRDLDRWTHVYYEIEPTTARERIVYFVEFMTFFPEFRNVFYLRAGIAGRPLHFMCPPLATLDIACRNIGAGLFIQHGMATLVNAESIGCNCWINQQVTIGYSDKIRRPTIGDNVRISAGAKVIGGIVVGDNAVIGPNTVVIDNVPSGATLLGVPGRIMFSNRARNAAAPTQG
jgi:serine O-acetyltransferase